MKSPKVQSPKSKVQSPDDKQRTADSGRQTNSKIILVGFMASGKTTIAKALSEKFDCAFVDLDQFIESRERRTIASIIDAEGEAHFRETETKALCEILENDSLKIMALGGGTWTIEENRKLISEHSCLTVWLDVPFEICWERIVQTGDTRPLARDKEKAQKLFDKRRKIYSLADLSITFNKKTNTETVLALFDKYFIV